ncbi:MAG TPA: hydrolase TatD [Porphyromonadaceae bacterium]|jgi:TatD DNase family protein|uniref:TatD family hydrolase n=1 Tax=Limibacterium fermenti TaxID=3229863 RepID=UPI000E8794C2|nr:hydrolase TatD [Porphyromonadaceae bacterium]HBX20706.1 hydrolase TatD [Porphyromonadaceae bacterium]HBX46680.1 hydrolase TatD [Porphyromonadaceae bacterium]HCM20731.1 hydrolase TatD [Porphyromonadaceae bacterium]
MRLIDTHAHLYSEDFANDLGEAVERAQASGVKKVLLPNIDVSSVRALQETVRSFPAFFIPMMGLHPTSVKEDWQEQLSVIREELNRTKYIGVGEIGIDLYWDETFREQQIRVFEEQLVWSKEKGLPVSIHSRNAFNEVVQSIKRVGERSLCGVFHSFGGSKEELQTALSFKNFYIGINGVVTFKNSGLSETLKGCPLERIVLETDSPYLAPVPYRGKRNESSYLTEIARKLSEITGLDPEEVAERTTLNAYTIFNITDWQSSLE